MMMNSQNSAFTIDENKSLFLGDLSSFCKEEDLYKIFRPFGEVIEIRIMRGRKSKSLAYGFITFADTESACAAKQLNGTVVMGRPIKIGWAKPRSAAEEKVPTQNDHVDTAQLHFSFIAKKRGFLVTEETIRAVFAQFGEVVDVSIKKSVVLEAQGEQNGYGFVYYPLSMPGIEAALQAAKVLQQVFVGSILVDCCLTWSLIDILKKLNVNPALYQETLLSARNKKYLESTRPKNNPMQPLSSPSSYEFSSYSNSFSTYQYSQAPVSSHYKPQSQPQRYAPMQSLPQSRYQFQPSFNSYVVEPPISSNISYNSYSSSSAPLDSFQYSSSTYNQFPSSIPSNSFNASVHSSSSTSSNSSFHSSPDYNKDPMSYSHPAFSAVDEEDPWLISASFN